MSSFGGTVKLTGESEYKKALAEISSNLKVLGSEMKAVSTQYDKNDKSVENLSGQNEVLNKQIAEQEKKVSILKEALEKSKNETGENSKQTKNWQTQLNNAQADLNTLNRKLDDNVSTMEEAIQGTKKETDAIEEFGEEAEKSGDKALSLGDIIKGNLISDAIKGGLSALAEGIKSVGSAMAGALADGSAYADNILTLSAQTGLSTDTLEKYNAVAELTDVSMETLMGSMAKNVKAMGEAQKGSAKYVEAYKQLGVSVTDANGNLRDSEEVYWETIDALKGIENETERDAMAMELFGKKAQDLNTIIEMGSEGVKEYTDKAVEMGAVLGGKGLEALGKLDDQMQIFSSTTASTGNILASAFAPAVASALEGVNGVAGAMNGLIASVLSGDGEAMQQAKENLNQNVQTLFENIQSMLPELLDIVQSLISTLADVIFENGLWFVSAGESILQSLISGITDNAGLIFETVAVLLSWVTTTILENLPMMIDMGCQLLISLVNGITITLPELIPIAISSVILMAETLIDNIDLIIDAGIELILALADGLLWALPDLIDKIPVIIDKLIVAITNNLPLIIGMGVELTIQLANGLIKATPQLISKIPSIIKSLVSGFKNYFSNMGDVGKNLVQGIWEGISNSMTWIKNKIKGWVGNVTEFLKSLFGIHSPSTLFRDEIGTNLALGLGEGFSDTMADVNEQMANSIPTEFDTQINMNAQTSTMSTYDTMLSAFRQALKEVKVVMDDREMGSFVTDTVTRVVYG